MDLFTKRCGCGAIFKPAVATSRSCTKCEATAVSAARAAVTQACSKESPHVMDALHPVGGDICARGPATNGVPTVKAGVLPKGSYKLDDLRRGHIPVRSDGAGLDRLGALWGVSRAVDATTGDMESDESFRRAINARQIRLEPRHMTMFNINVEQEARDINMELQTKARYTPNTPEARHWLRTIVDDSWKELLETKAIRDYQVYPSWLPHLDMAGGNGWKLLAEVKDVKGSYWRFEIVIR